MTFRSKRRNRLTTLLGAGAVALLVAGAAGQTATSPEVARLVGSDTASEDGFGWAVAREGDVVAVGSPLAGSGIRLGEPGLGAGDSAARFDSGEGRVRIEHDNGLTPKQITIEAVVQWDGPNGSRQSIVEKSRGSSGSATLYKLAIREDDMVEVELFTIKTTGGGQILQLVSSAPLTAGPETVHLAVTYGTDSTLRLYIDGSLDAEQVAPEPATAARKTNPLGIGNKIERDRPFHGTIDEVAIYNGALSAGDLAAHQIALDGSGAYASAVLAHANLVGHWRFEEVSVDEPAVDQSGNGRDGVYLTGEEGGVVHVLRKVGTEWMQEAVLVGSNTNRMDRFGTAVALSGDTLAVGAQYQNDFAGAVYVFRDGPGGWTEEARLDRANVALDNWDLFGQCLALDGDTLVVGANADDDDATNAGAVYLFERSGTTWTQIEKLTAEADAEASVHFGHAVSLDGDTLVVGAGYENGTDAGKAYVFARAGGTWTRSDTLTAPGGAAACEHFGRAVAVEGDLLAVGAPGTDGAFGADSGTVHLFARDVVEPTTWVHVTALEASDASAGAEFGAALAISDNTILPGAPGAAGGGAAYLITPTPTGWTEKSKLEGAAPSADARLGTSVALDGGDLVVGAETDDAVGLNSGSLSLFDLRPQHAVWVWHKAKESDDGFDWRDPAEQTALIDRCVASGVNTIYFSVYLSPVAGWIQPKPGEGRMIHWDVLRPLISDAHANGLEFWVVYGDTAYPDQWSASGFDASGVPSGQPAWHAAQRLHDVIAYNEDPGTPGEARFDGVMLDVEVGNIAAWDSRSDDSQKTWYRSMCDLYSAFQVTGGEHGLKVGAAINSNWENGSPTYARWGALDYPAGGVAKDVYKHVIDTQLDQIVVMGYSDSAVGVEAADEDEVAYATSLGLAGRVLAGLETKDLGVGSDESFFEDGQDDLNAAAHAVAEEFSYESSFGGFMVHSYGDSYLSGTTAWPASNTGLWTP